MTWPFKYKIIKRGTAVQKTEFRGLFEDEVVLNLYELVNWKKGTYAGAKFYREERGRCPLTWNLS